MAQVIPGRIRQFFDEAGIIVAALECRVKTEASLAGKLELKGAKYRDLYDLTDILGLRVITFYIDDVDKVASVLERLFEIDWEKSIDKRKAHEIDSFGYLSLHYICRIPESAYQSLEHPELNKIHFEVQMRTVLQHAWANMNHDTGYKSGVEVPKEYLRSMSRLAGMLELADEQFSYIRTEINNYRRQVKGLVASGKLEEVALDGDTFRSYLELKPFDKLNRRIAAVNQAEIQEVSLMPWLAVFKGIGTKTLGDIDSLIKNYGEAAYQIACYQIGLTDLDIISSSIAPQNLSIAYVLKSGGGKAGIKYIFDLLGGPSDANDTLADMLLEQAQGLPFMNQKTEDGEQTA
ncbi:MAG: hypothetical protein IJ721_10355 [Bacteroidales bacterium]|nr:hypothetical protein [Bacteroidales bacterium]